MKIPSPDEVQPIIDKLHAEDVVAREAKLASIMEQIAEAMKKGEGILFDVALPEAADSLYVKRHLPGRLYAAG